jgi:hypothetical protein
MTDDGTQTTEENGFTLPDLLSTVVCPLTSDLKPILRRGRHGAAWGGRWGRRTPHMKAPVK